MTFELHVDSELCMIPTHASLSAELAFFSQKCDKSPTGRGMSIPVVEKIWMASRYQPSMAMENHDAPVP